MVQRESCLRMVVATVEKKLKEYYDHLTSSKQQALKRFLSKRNGVDQNSSEADQKIRVTSYLNNIASRKTYEIEFEHLHSDNVKEGDIVQPWNKEATESGIKEINQAISGEIAQALRRRVRTSSQLSPNHAMRGRLTPSLPAKSPPLGWPQPGEKRNRTTNDDSSRPTSARSVKPRETKTSEKVFPSGSKGSFSQHNLGSSGGVKIRPKAQHIQPSSSMDKGASIPSQQMPTPKTNGDNRPYCRCVPLGPRESLADRISKYIRFEHQGITYTAGELQCTEFISIVDLTKLAAHTCLTQKVDATSMTDEEYNNFADRFHEICESVTPSDATSTRDVVEAMVRQTMSYTLTDVQKQRWSANWEALGMNAFDADPRSLEPNEEDDNDCKHSAEEIAEPIPDPHSGMHKFPFHDDEDSGRNEEPPACRGDASSPEWSNEDILFCPQSRTCTTAVRENIFLVDDADTKSFLHQLPIELTSGTRQIHIKAENERRPSQ